MLSVLLAFQVAGQCVLPASQAPAAGEVTAQWAAFRTTHRHLVQTIALSQPAADGSRVLIISEPPPHVTVSGIQSIAPQVFADLHVCRDRVGYDGWVKDVAIRVAPPVGTALIDAITALQLYVYGTTYKAWIEDLGAPAPAGPRPRLDIRVSSADIRRWTIGGTTRFSRSSGEAAVPLSVLLTPGHEGVYYNQGRGLVAWVVSRQGDLARFRRQARQLALDADLIVGAVASPTTVAILGRERIVSPLILPPLRVETILQLAAVRNEHLAQSYERTFLFAGATKTGDWAPIYLSAQLIDTEYGSLLNLTDQLLKNWSQHGTVSYAGFTYDVPPSYPFPRPLMDFLGVEMLTFNWNTEGAGYTDQRANLAVYALNRTGALPVSYLGSSLGREPVPQAAAEDRGAEYFASISDPNLVRVIQYAALYQAFTAFGLRATSPPVPARPSTYLAFRPLLRQALMVVPTVRADSLRLRWRPEWFEGNAWFLRELSCVQRLLGQISSSGGNPSMDRVVERMLQDRQTDSAMALRVRDRALLRRTLSSNCEISAQASPAERLAAQEALASRYLPRVVKELLTARDLASARAVFEVASQRADSGWLRTPSLVLSSSDGGTGGHNLDAAVTRFRISATQPPRRVRVIQEGGERIVLVNEADMPRLASLTRVIARESDDLALTRRLNTRLGSMSPPPPRTLSAALNLPPQLPPVRGLVPEPRLSRTGFGSAGRPLTAAEAAEIQAYQTAGSPFVEVSRLSDGRFQIVSGGNRDIIMANTTLSAADATVFQALNSGASELRMVMRGFSTEEARAFSLNTERVMATEALPIESRAVLEGPGVNRGVTWARLRTEIDVKRARVSDLTAETIADARGGRVDVHRATIELPPLEVGRPSVFGRIWIYFRDMVNNPGLETMRGLFDNAMGALGRSNATSLERAATVLRRELRRAHPNIERVEVELGDILIVEITPVSRIVDSAP